MNKILTLVFILLLSAQSSVSLQNLAKFVKTGETIVLECITDKNVTMIWSYLKTIKIAEITLTEDTIVNPIYIAKVNLTGNKYLGEYFLKIINVSSQDEGKYRCYQRGQKISIVQVNLRIEVAPNDLLIFNQQTDGIINGTEGQMLNITCQVRGGNTKGNISWINVSDVLSNFTELIEWPFVYLNFTTDYKQHGKKLTCGIAHALLRGQQEVSVKLNILYRPKIYIKKHSVDELTEGQQIRLECLDRSNPPKTKLTWEKNGIILSSHPIYEKTNIETNDSGIYTCIVFNSLGRELENISIFINKGKDTYNGDADSPTEIGPLEIVMIYVFICSCGTLLFCSAACVLPICRRVKKKPTVLDK